MSANSSRTRSVLMELNLRSGSLNNQQNISLVWNPRTISPDEEVIQQRGRRKAAEIAAANIQALTPQKSPKSPKNSSSPTKLGLRTPEKLQPTRFSPRKRLNLGHELLTPPDDTPGSSKIRKFGSPHKRPRLQLSSKHPVNVEVAINALNQSQLVELMQRLMESHPEIKQEVTDIMPEPDLQPLESKLAYLQRNVLKSISRNVWGSDKDVYSFRRVSPHLDLFKKECVQQGAQLVNGQQWSAVMYYVFMAWKYVHKLPNWDDKAQDKIKEQCFKSLASHCMNALKKGDFDIEDLKVFEERLADMASENASILPCMKYIQTQIEKFN